MFLCNIRQNIAADASNGLTFWCASSASKLVGVEDVPSRPSVEISDVLFLLACTSPLPRLSLRLRMAGGLASCSCCSWRKASVLFAAISGDIKVVKLRMFELDLDNTRNA